MQPDSVELVFDDQKREISALGVWLRKVLSALETAFKVRGESLPSEDRRSRQNDSGPASSSSDLDDRRYQSEEDDFYTNDFQYDGDVNYQSQDMGTTLKKPRNDSRHGNIGSVVRSPKRALKGYRNRKTQAVDTFMESFNKNQRGMNTGNAKQERRKAKYATSLDDFEFIQFSSEQQRDLFLSGESSLRSSRTSATHDVLQASNVRLPGKKRPMAPTDPRWDWLKQGRAKAQAQASKQSKMTLLSGSAPSSSTLSTLQRSSHKRKDQEKLIGHVQNARLQLREKRYQKMRYPSSGGGGIRGVAPSFVPGYGYDPLLMAARNESMTFSVSQQRPQYQPHQQQQNSRLGESTSLESSGGGVSTSAKSTFFTRHTSGVAAPPSSLLPESQTVGPQINWENVFDVVSGAVDDKELPGLGLERRTFLMTCGLLECTCGRHQISCFGAHSALLLGEEVLTDSSFDDAIKGIASRLRQDLNALRFQEFEFLRSLSGSSGRPADSETEPAAYTDSPEWHSLVDRADRYHASLALLVRHAVQSVQDQLEMATGVPSALVIVTHLVRAIVVEISHIIAQLSDCESLFSSCPSYVFFFEVADRNAKTTPLLTAITRTYWYIIQALLDLKQAANTTTTGAQAVEASIESVLPTNRAILAASLFLVDLYLFLPSSYRLDLDPSEQQQQADTLSHIEAPMPAISLWLLIYDCFASGRCLFQTGKRSASGDGRDFWAFLQTMVQ